MYLTEISYSYGFYIFLLIAPLAFLLLIFQNVSKELLITIMVLFTFNLIYCIIILMNDFIAPGLIPIHVFFPTLALISGYFITEDSKKYKRIYIVIFSIMIATTIFITLSYLRTISFYGSLDSAASYYNNRALGTIWNVSERVPATNITLRLLLSLSLLPTIFLFTKEYSKRFMTTSKLITIFCFIPSFVITLQMGSRTSVVVLIATFLFFYLFIGKLTFKKIGYLILMICTSGVIYFFYSLDFLNLQSWWHATRTYRRFTSVGLESGRNEAWKEVISDFFKYPFGGREIQIKINYVHNLWLDVIYDAGWIAGLILIIFTFISISSFLKFFYSNHPIYLKAIFLLLFLSFLLFFMIEPILPTDERDYFVLFCFFIGTVLGLNKKRRL